MQFVIRISIDTEESEQRAPSPVLQALAALVPTLLDHLHPNTPESELKPEPETE